MSPPLRLRLLTGEDLPFADSLRAVVGWNQTLEDWQRFLALEPQGCFLAEWNGTAAGTATTLVYGPELAWIGMVLVHPDHRRRGIGRALLVHCLDHLRRRGVRCIKLDATPLGQPVYEGLGFQSEWTLSRWEHDGTERGRLVRTCPTNDASNRGPLVPACSSNDSGERERTARGSSGSGEARIRSAEPSDVRFMRPLDTAAFGVPRERLIEALIPHCRAALVLDPAADQIAAYGLLRRGARALYLGPVVAASAEDGLSLIQSLLAAGAGEKLFWDIPDQNTPAVSAATDHGFTRQRSLTRMFLGQNTAPGDPRMQFGLAGPEVG